MLTEPDSDLDLYEVVALIWRARWLVLLAAMAAGAAGAAYAFLAPQWYRAEVVMLPAEGGGLGGKLGQLGSLAALAGVSIGTGDGESQTPLAVLRSKSFVRDFITERDLVKTVLAHQWDARNGKWTVSGPEPDLRDAVDYFERKVREISEDKKTGEIRMSISWHDPEVAAEWANELAARANARLRERALHESERNVKYLQDEIRATPVASLQQSIGKVLESELEKMMLARGADEYAFRVVDQAYPPKKRAWPLRPVVIIASLLLGLVLAVTAVLLGNGLADRRRSGPRTGATQ